VSIPKSAREPVVGINGEGVQRGGSCDVRIKDKIVNGDTNDSKDTDAD
jgi:hypothetical protein